MPLPRLPLRRLSLSHLTVLEVGPPELVTLAAQAGFASFGLRLAPAMPGGVAYPLPPDGAARAATRRLMSDLGVTLEDAEVVRLAPETDPADFDAMMASAAELGARRLTVNVDDPDRQRTIDRFGALCRRAAGFGLSVDLEFMIWRPVARLADAVDIVTAAGCPNGAVLVDSLHLFRSGGTVSDVAALAAAQPQRIGAVQLCDAPAVAPPPSGIVDEARGGRLPPGSGSLPLGPLLDVLLPVLPPDRPISLEVPLRGSATPLARATRVRQETEAWLQALVDRPAMRASLP